jgi:hypothetical protein
MGFNEVGGTGDRPPDEHGIIPVCRRLSSALAGGPRIPHDTDFRLAGAGVVVSLARP